MVEDFAMQFVRFILFPSPVEAAKVGSGGNHIVETHASTVKICIARSLVALLNMYRQLERITVG